MRIIDILPAYEAKRFDRPFILGRDAQKDVFKLDEAMKKYLKSLKHPFNKIGFLLQYGYFKVNGKFFTKDKFRPYDVRYIAQRLSIPSSLNHLRNYTDRTRQNHRKMILKMLACTEFWDMRDDFEKVISDMAKRQMHPRKIFYAVVDFLKRKHIELPNYNYMAKVITRKFRIFEKMILERLSQSLLPGHKDTLEALISGYDDYYQRALITRLKTLYQSTRPSKIRHSLQNFLIIKKLFEELKPVIESLDLSTEATRYYAQWVLKSKTSQISDLSTPEKKYLHLIAFIIHYFKVSQDTLVDILLKSVQQHINKAERTVQMVSHDFLLQKNKLASSVLYGFEEAQTALEAVSQTLYNEALNSDEKLRKLRKIVPPREENVFLLASKTDAQALKKQITLENQKKDYFKILSKRSRKMQNQVADIVKYLEFDFYNGSQDLLKAIQFYKVEQNLRSSAPSSFLEEREYQEIFCGEKFQVSLYKAILFCKIAASIKSGHISLTHSYRYLSIESYLIDKTTWERDRKHILEKFHLEQFQDIDNVLGALKKRLDRQFLFVNKRIITKKNKHTKIYKSGGFSLHTPAALKPDYDSVADIIGKNKYIPILQMMAEINALTQFNSHFKHHKISGAKAKPSDKIFYAGIFALGSQIGLHKLANTAIGINYNTLVNTVNWYFSLENLYAVNHALTEIMGKLWLPKNFLREKTFLHTSSDGQKNCVSAESLNANYSYKYHGNGQGASIYRFIDERGILFYSTVFSSSEREAAYVIDGLYHDANVKSTMHSTDTHGYTEMIFAVSHLLGVTFAPRIKDVGSQNLVSFEKIRPDLEKKGYPIQPSYYVREHKIKHDWDNVLRLIASVQMREHRASTILKRLNSYSKQHPLQEALREFGRIIKSIFILKYTDDVVLRQAIDKQLNKSELANSFATAMSFGDKEIMEVHKEEQEQSAMCKTILQNVIILWNYIELTKIIMRSDKGTADALLEDIKNSSILTWQHVNLHGTYDFSALDAESRDEISLKEVINFKVA